MKVGEREKKSPHPLLLKLMLSCSLSLMLEEEQFPIDSELEETVQSK